MPRPTNYNTDTGTGSYGNSVSMSKNNGVTKYKNNITGTERYGYNVSNGTYYPGGSSKQTSLANKYAGNTSRGGGSSGGGSSSGGGGGEMPTYTVRDNTDEIVNRIQALLNEQKAQADAYYKSLYEQQLSQNKQAWEDNRNQINLNYKRAERFLNNNYGNAVSGAGLSNRTRNYTNWNNNLAENQRNYANNNASALSSYNQGLANNASTLAQGWYNYVLPVYTNRQRNIDDYDYRRYLASLG